MGGDVYDVGVFTLFLFQMVFMDTAATIPTGAMAERWRFSSFLVYGLFMSALLYPLYGNWVWGGGWLSTLGQHLGLGHGHVDFAGATVVHMTGGVTALAGAIALGPRLQQPVVALAWAVFFGGMGFGGADVHAVDARMRVGRAHQAHVEHALELVVVNELAVTAYQAVFFLAAKRLAGPCRFDVSGHDAAPAVRSSPAANC